jgi:type IV pilus assembly protein PilM
MLAALRARSGHRATHPALGLDIGSTAVKVIELRRPGSPSAVARWASVPLAPGIVAEGSIRDAAAVAAAIRTAVATAGITATDAAVGICGRELIIKKLQIPGIPAKALKDAVRIEAEREIPFAIDEVFLDYQVTGRQPRVIDLTLVAAKKSKVLEYHAAVTAAGLTPAVIDVDGFALGNQFALATPATAERVALVDVGATLTKIAVVGGALTHLVRDAPLGGSRYTQAIAARLGISLESAEAIKTEVAGNSDSLTVAQVCDGVSRELGREIQRALDYHAESDVTAPPVTRVALLGGGAALTGLVESLTGTLGLPVAVARPFDGLIVEPPFEQANAGLGPALALALGLSLRRRGDAGSP